MSIFSLNSLLVNSFFTVDSCNFVINVFNLICEGQGNETNDNLCIETTNHVFEPLLGVLTVYETLCGCTGKTFTAMTALEARVVVGTIRGAR